jgi:penicillin-binding protein 1C
MLYRLLFFSVVFALAYLVFRPTGEILSETGFSQVVYSREKKPLRITLTNDDKYRLFCHVNSSGSLIKEAVLMKEDRFFYHHPGVNIFAILKAINQTYILQKARIGGSTISMQVARMLYGLKTRSIGGKIKQMFYAFYLEIYYTKDEILEAYINLVPCGGNIEGFATASLMYFEKELSKITLQEALFLSVLPQSPSKYSPKDKVISSDITKARIRLFDQWHKVKGTRASPEQLAEVKMPLSTEYFAPFDAPHFCTAVLKEHTDEGRIYTTLDRKLQKMVERLGKQYVRRKNILGVNNAAILLVDYQNNMEVLASLGSTDFFDDQIQGQVDGTRSRRSPGSTLKPLVYALGIEQGIIHPMTMLKDAPVSYSGYAPDNYELDFKGPIKAWQALINSRNVPAVSLAMEIDEPDLYDLLDDLSIGQLQPKDHYGLSIVLGSAELSMMELVSLYGLLANNGTYQKPNEVFSSGGYKNQPWNYIRLGWEACWLTKHILTRNPPPYSRNSSLRAGLGHINGGMPIIAYKTGTSIGFKDCWSVGIFDKYILAVWLGNFDGYGNPAFNGRKLATPLMYEIARNVLVDNPALITDELSKEMAMMPQGIRKLDVCAVSGNLPNPNCQRKLPTFFIPGKSSIEKCDICRLIYVDTKTGYGSYVSDKDTKAEVFEFWPTNLMKIFRQAGVPRKTPPKFHPSNLRNHMSFHNGESIGIVPSIESPVSGTQYLMSPTEEVFNNLPLKATVDADVEEVFWYVDEQFVGRTDPNQTEYWSLRPGTFEIGVVDDKGRSSTRTVVIGVAMN